MGQAKKSDYTKELFQLVNHRLRTPLSVIVHELEYLIYQGQEDCKLAHARALEISQMLGDFSKLTDENEPVQEVQLSLLTSTLTRSIPDLVYKIGPSIVVQTRPRQISSALMELMNLLHGKAPLVTSLELNASSNSLKIAGIACTAESLSSTATYTSLQGLISAISRRPHPIAKVIDGILIENKIRFSAKADSGKVFVNLKFPEKSKD